MRHRLETNRFHVRCGPNGLVKWYAGPHYRLGGGIIVSRPFSMSARHGANVRSFRSCKGKDNPTDYWIVWRIVPGVGLENLANRRITPNRCMSRVDALRAGLALAAPLSLLDVQGKLDTQGDVTEYLRSLVAEALPEYVYENGWMRRKRTETT